MISKSEMTLCFVTVDRPMFLKESLSSVAKFPNLIVYDNGSSSSNINLTKAFSKKYNTSVIFCEKNEGLMKAWNQCIINSNTDWVCVCPDDIVFRKDWFDDFNKILTKRPQTKIVFGNNYDCIIIHKSIIPKIGWWDENYRQYPSSEDYGFHLNLTNILGYSPYCWPGDHIQGDERKRRLEVVNKNKINYLREDNFTYWCTYPDSLCDVFCKEIPHIKDGASYAKKDPNVETGQQYFDRIYEQCEEKDEGSLLNIDCLYYRLRDRSGKTISNPYPEITKEYERKYTEK